MSEHKKIFSILYETAEGGLVKVPNDTVYLCRVCQMTPNMGIQSERQWLQHLLSNSHQSIHRAHQLLRKVLWNLDRTVAITQVSGIHPRDILNYVAQSGSTEVDFSDLSSKPGGTDGCYALLSTLSEVEKLTSSKAHNINGKKFNIRLIDKNEKMKHLKWREKLIIENGEKY